MIYFLFAISYLLDIILLILLVILILGVLQLIKSLGQDFKLLEKIKIIPKIISAKPAVTFNQYAQKNQTGTYTVSYDQHKKINTLIKRLTGGLLGFVTVKLIIISLIFLNIPRLGEAQPKGYNAFYQINDHSSYSQGTATLTEWDEDGITLSAGQNSGNYVSATIGNGKDLNQWKNLSWEMDNSYNQKPDYPKSTIAAWDLDSLDNCTSEKYSTYACQTSNVMATQGIYNSSAYSFDGFKSKVKISQNLNFSGSFTIGAWIKPNINLLVGSEDQNFTILAKGYGDYLDKKPYEFRYNFFFGFKNGSLTLIFWSDTNKDHWVMAKNTKYNFVAPNWYHVAGVYDDKAKTLKLYIDGIEQTTMVADYDGDKIDHPFYNKDNFPSWIGSSAYRWQDNEEKLFNVFNGDIDEVFVANSALDILDIRKLVNQSGVITFQVRTGDTLPLNSDFFGPNNDQTAYFTLPQNNDLSFLNPSKYLQFIAYFYRPNTNFKPKLKSVNLEYFVPQETELRIALKANESNGSQLTRDLNKERQGIAVFINFFKAKPVSDLDWQFVNLVAYNNVEQRDLSAEQTAITAFVKKMKRLPKSDLDWGIIRALAYCPKGQTLLASWLNLK